MRTRAKTLVAVVGLSALAVVGTDAVTYATAGQSLILGHANKSGPTTHLTSTGKGPALSLHAKGDRPALAVDSTARVIRLNADRVDGKDARALQNNVRVYTRGSAASSYGELGFKLPRVARGRYQVTYDLVMEDLDGTTASPTTTRCYVHTIDEDGVLVASAFETTVSIDGFAGLSGSSVVRKTDRTLWLSCNAFRFGTGPDDWTVGPTGPVRVTLTRIDRAVSGRLGVERHPGPAIGQLGR